MKYSSLVPGLHEGKAQALQETPERLKLASTSWSQSRLLSPALPSFGNADSTIYTLLWGVGTPVDCQRSILSTYTRLFTAQLAERALKLPCSQALMVIWALRASDWNT